MNTIIKNKIFICATEQSGDNIGSKIIEELKINNTFVIDGVGGRKISKLIGRNIKFPMLNMNGNSGYYESYTSENIEIVKDLFSIDFDNFKYSTNFEESNE